MTDLEICKLLRHIADAIQLADQVSSQHTCNDCGIMKTCYYTPKLGDLVRINCPLWKGEADD